MYKTISEIKEANEKAGFYFFERDTMRFFDSKIIGKVIGGRYFVTSEKGPDGIRAFTVREAMPDGDINTVGKFQQFQTAAKAIAYAKAQNKVAS